MRKLQLPDVKFTALSEGGEERITINAAQQLYRLVMFARAPQEGFTIDDIRKRLPLGEKLDQADKEVFLEDAEFNILKECFNKASWLSVTPSVVTLADAIENAEVVNVDKESSS